MQSTIVALATPNGRSGIGVVRLSGPDALGIAAYLTGSKGFSPSVRVATLANLRDADGGVLDSALITYFKAPNSFTGEDTIELSCHGSPIVLREVIEICLRHGARLADPGEFTLRALVNGCMDLAEAEAVRDLIDAQTSAAARQAVRQLRGELSLRLQPLKDRLLDIIVLLESALEFVEDDLPETQTAQVRRDLSSIKAETELLSNTFRHGHLIRDGLRVAIVGRPNVGKSSLFNALLGSERAIVTDIEGTTRDQLHERFMIGDIPISLIDTAGLRETNDLVESIGVGRSKAVMADADLVIVMLDASRQISDEDREILQNVTDLNYIVAINKIDAAPASDIDRLVAAEHSTLSHLRKISVPISAKTGEGLDDLRSAITGQFLTADAGTEGLLITDARHHDLLVRAFSEMEQSIHQLDGRMSEEIVLIGLHNALRYLGEITGETTTEDMLTRIFSTFCIGK